MSCSFKVACTISTAVNQKGNRKSSNYWSEDRRMRRTAEMKFLMTNRSTDALPEMRYFWSNPGLIREIPTNGRITLRRLKENLQKLCPLASFQLWKQQQRRVGLRRLRWTKSSELPSDDLRRNPFLVRLSSISFFIQPKAAVQPQEYGRGNRVRKQVNYCDDWTD